MVRHVHRGRDYWTLPGGGVKEDETLREAVVREVLEETCLHVNTGRFLYQEIYSLGTNYCFEAIEIGEQEIKLGVDPEDEYRNPEERILQDVAWRLLEDVQNDFQIAKVLEALEENRRKNA